MAHRQIAGLATWDWRGVAFRHIIITPFRRHYFKEKSMPLVMGLDVGTTTITALALDAGSGQIVARETAGNDA